VYDKETTMTAKKFSEMTTRLVFKSIREKTPRADKVIVQMDGHLAPGPTGKETPVILNRAGKIAKARWPYHLDDYAALQLSSPQRQRPRFLP
jgi:hypothetical protein